MLTRDDKYRSLNSISEEEREELIKNRINLNISSEINVQ